MQLIVTVGVRSHFESDAIDEFWRVFFGQYTNDPYRESYQVGEHRDERSPITPPHVQDVWVKVDEYHESRVATMRLADEL